MIPVRQNPFGQGPFALGLLFLGLIFSACTSIRIQYEDLPSTPIAFLHWEDKPAQKRSETFAAAGELPAPLEDRDNPEGAMDREIGAYLQAEQTSVLSHRLSEHPGKVTLYWPQRDETELIESAPRGARPLAWSSDHRRLLLVSAHRDKRQQLYEYDVEQKHLTTLTFSPGEHVRGDFDDSDRMVILKVERRRQGAARKTVFLATSVGQIEGEVARGIDVGTLRFSPSGDRIVYEKVRPRLRRDGPTVFDSFIAAESLEKGAEEQILGKGREPTFTPDGDWIVFASPSSAGYRLRRMRLDGTSKVPIGPGGTDERMPTVSPDGQYIAFIKDSGSTRRLYVRQFDGKRERALVLKGWSEFPVW